MRKGNDLNSPAPKRSDSNLASERLNGSYVDSVRQRAYEIYEMRMSSNSPGDPMTDWLQAEEQVRTNLTRDSDIMA